MAFGVQGDIVLRVLSSKFEKKLLNGFRDIAVHGRRRRRRRRRRRPIPIGYGLSAGNLKTNQAKYITVQTCKK